MPGKSSANIAVRGAKQHNLQNVDLELPKNSLVTISGPSGSGKSSLAFDTLFAEAQRRYVESLSSYARQFLEQLAKPDVEHIEGLSPAIAIEQRTLSRSPRSTVGTITEINDYLRLLYARVGAPWCSRCGKEIKAQSAEDIINYILNLPKRTKLQLLAPLVRQKKGSHKKLLENVQKEGFVRVRIDGEFLTFDEEIKLDSKKPHDIELVVDRLVTKDDIRNRLADSVELSLKHAEGLIIIWQQTPEGDISETLQSEHFACPDCDIYFPKLEPRSFSFNSPAGACSRCNGLGQVQELAEDLIIRNPKLSIDEGAIHPWWVRPKLDRKYRRLITRVCKHYDQPMDVAWEKLPVDFRQVILHGSGDNKGDFSLAGRRRKRSVTFDGVIANLQKRYKDTESEKVKEFVSGFMNKQTCPDCEGLRLRKEALMVRVGNKTIAEVNALSIENLAEFFSKLELDTVAASIAQPILEEIRNRVSFLLQTGLSYLSLERRADTLSGGEAQRIRLASQIGSGLTGVLYVLDEPSIGLHQRDNERLIQSIKALRDLGNSLIVVEHDKSTLLESDWIIDMGPGAGSEGGRVVAEGTPKQLLKQNSLTAKFLSDKLEVFRPKKRRQGKGPKLSLAGASLHNLKNASVELPLGHFICVAGVSGSGKSSLINQTLYPALLKELGLQTKTLPGPFEKLSGVKHIDKVIRIDQSPIGRTPRSNPATYVGVFGLVRSLFSKLPEAKARGYSPGRFSFNVKGGRCEKCMGGGLIKVEMQFLADMYVPCEDCGGKRYNTETLDIRFKGLHIAEVLDLPVTKACEVFRNQPAIAEKLHTLQSVGLGYLTLGQSATTLSGGEAQRVKLAAELSKKQTGQTLYLLDEPTTGLHPSDIDVLLRMLHELVDKGNTVVVIEHNLDVINSADWVIELGPDGGDRGGDVIAIGTPEELAKNSCSVTGRFL